MMDASNLSTRVLYIHAVPYLEGTILFDGLRAVSDAMLLGAAVVSDREYDYFVSQEHPQSEELVSHSMFFNFDPNVIYIEGGLIRGVERAWPLPQDFAEKMVLGGGLLIIADLYSAEVHDYLSDYQNVPEFIGTRPRVRGSGDEADLVYGFDERENDDGNERRIVCRPDSMNVAQSLHPVYRDVDQICVTAPIELHGGAELATGNAQTSGTLWKDLIHHYPFPFPFAVFSRWGLGYVITIGARVSEDYLSEKYPGNITWLQNIIHFFLEQSAANQSRSKSHIRSGHKVFISHRSVNKDIVEPAAREIKRRGVDVWIDSAEIIPSDSLVDRIGEGLSEMTHFALFWSGDCVNAPWVKFELDNALTMLVEENIPVFVIRLDEADVPKSLSSRIRIEAQGMDSSEIADAVTSAIEHLENRKKAS